VLCADDSPGMRAMLRDVLSAAGYEVGLVTDGSEALAAIREREPDLLILDLLMPGMSGLDVCRRLKADPFTAGIPVLMLTGQGSVEHRVEGFDAGADEYLSKPFDARELQSRVAALLRLVRRESDRNPTSGLPGGKAIEEEIGRRGEASLAFAVCYLDLDHFKAFADAFGFAVADNVIRELAVVLREVVRLEPQASAFVGHIGGDDFVIVCAPDRAEAIARMVGERFRWVVARVVGAGAVARGRFSGVDRAGNAREFPVATLSAAVLLVSPGDQVDIARIGALAAEVKRLAKERGAGTIVVQQV
jgi:DNA-binding response OmpR family regulator